MAEPRLTKAEIDRLSDAIGSALCGDHKPLNYWFNDHCPEWTVEQIREQVPPLLRAVVAALDQTAEHNSRALIACVGCGATPMTAVRAICAGHVACCPDCSTFTAQERNEIRELFRQQRPATDSPDRPEQSEPVLSDGPVESVAGSLYRLNPNRTQCKDCGDRFVPVRGPDAHPESTCQRCGGPNPTPWFADNALWNGVVGGEGGIWCPNCFVAEAQRQGHIPRVTVAKTQLVPVDPTIPREYGQQYRLCQIEECESDEESGENRATVCGKCYEKVAPAPLKVGDRVVYTDEGQTKGTVLRVCDDSPLVYILWDDDDLLSQAGDAERPSDLRRVEEEKP